MTSAELEEIVALFRRLVEALETMADAAPPTALHVVAFRALVEGWRKDAEQATTADHDAVTLRDCANELEAILDAVPPRAAAG